MLRVGVTGGIGSGKSTVARRLGELGAEVVDADRVAREVVEPGTPVLRLIRERFGEGVIRAEGSLDRARLADLVFTDPAALRDLEAITGPAIAERVATLRAAVPPGVVSVFDMPLLVERGLWVHEHLAVVVGADPEVRVRRLVEQRGLREADVRARMATQATDADRRAAADVWLENDGTESSLAQSADALWQERIAPFNANVVGGIRAVPPNLEAVVEPRADWAERGLRATARIGAALTAAGARAQVEHVGSTSVPGLPARDVVDVQVGLATLETADDPAVRDAMRTAGYVLVPGDDQDTPLPAGASPAGWRKRCYGSCDPGNVVHVHVRQVGSPGWHFALLLRDWLRACPKELRAYAAAERRLLESDPRTSGGAAAHEPWLAGAFSRAQAWATSTRWSPAA